MMRTQRHELHQRNGDLLKYGLAYTIIGGVILLILSTLGGFAIAWFTS